MSETSRASVRAALKKRRAVLRTRGLCVDCGFRKVAPTSKCLCAECLKNRREREAMRRVGAKQTAAEWLKDGERMAREQISKAKEGEDGKAQEGRNALRADRAHS